MINEYYATRLSLAFSSIIGSLISFRFLQMGWKGRLTAACSAMGMASLLGPWLTDKLSIQPEFIGCLMGMFGIAICDALYKGINNSDLSFKIDDLFNLFGKEE